MILSRKKHVALSAIATAVLFCSCGGTKKYKVPQAVEQEATLQISGVNSKGSIPGLVRRVSFVGVSEYNFKTCEKFWYGDIRAKGSKSSDVKPLPSGRLLNLFFVRHSNSMWNGVKNVSHDIYFAPKAGATYRLEAYDLEKGLYDLKMYEKIDGVENQISDVLSEREVEAMRKNSGCKKYKIIRKYRKFEAPQ